MLLLGIDLETGGSFSEPIDKNFITEVGAVLWDTELEMPVKMYSSFVFNLEKNICQEASEYTGITNELVGRYGLMDYKVKERIESLILEADFIVAHNGNAFDKPILEKWLTEDENDYSRFKPRPWIDTMEDVPYPKNCKNTNLTYLAGFHGFCNPFPHRAVFDACAMLKILSMYNLDEIIENVMADQIIIQADVSYLDRNLAKDRGFNFEKAGGKTFAKKWVKKIRKDHLQKFMEGRVFPIHILEEIKNVNKKES